MSRASHARDRAKSSPAALGTLGALAGGTLGMLLGRKARKGRQSSWEEESHYVPAGRFQSESGFGTRDYTAEPAYTPRTSAPYPDYSTSPEVSTFGAESWSEPYRSPAVEESWQQSAGPQPQPRQQEEEGSKGEKLKEKTAEFKGKSSELKEKASHKASDLKHRMSDKAGGLRHKTEDLRHKMQERSSRQGEGGGPSHLKERIPSASDLKQTARKRPMGVILGGMAIGALAASLLPLSRRERKTMHPAKEKARHQLEDQFSTIKHNVEDKLGMGGDESHDQEQGERSSERSFEASRPPQGGSFTSAGTSGTSGPYATASSNEGFGSSERTSREELGLRSNPDEPYRQPSLAEQLENKDKIH